MATFAPIMDETYWGACFSDFRQYRGRACTEWLPLLPGHVRDMQRVDMVLGTVGEPSPVDCCGVWLGRHLSIRREVAFSPGPLVGGNMELRGLEIVPENRCSCEMCIPKDVQMRGSGLYHGFPERTRMCRREELEEHPLPQ